MKKSRVIDVGGVKIGGDNDIRIQSMTNTKTKDIDATVQQIKQLEEVGCEIIRMAINDEEDAKAIPKIKENISIPVIADIQYDYRLALWAIENGADGLRINPGNIGGEERVREIVEACSKKGISIRVGVNAGSLNQKFLDKYNGVNENSMVYSALEQVEMLEKWGFKDIKISLKASNVDLTVRANRKMREMVDYPLHLGITEAGPGLKGTIKSAVGIGIMLHEGIGETIRVSLTEDPVDEIIAAKEILRSLGLYNKGVEIISCPTCARTEIDLINMVKEAEKRLDKVDKNIKVAIMGCPVNGPGEAREADIGIAGGKNEGLIFKKGKVYKKMKEFELLDELVKEIEKL